MEQDLAKIYDEFAGLYDENRMRFDIDDVLNCFYRKLPANEGTLLDLGCGCGLPCSRFFVDKGWDVVGVDFSQAMLGLAQRYVPSMKTIHADMRKVSFSDNQFDAIVAIYSLFHLPSEEHLGMFKSFKQWLKKDGIILFTYATRDYTGSEEFSGLKTFMDRDLFYSHKNLPNMLADIMASGLELLEMQKREIGGEKFLWVTCGK